MAPEALARRVIAALLVCCIAVGCSRGAGGVAISWTIEPPSPVVGADTIVRFVLRQRDGTPIGGAALHLEAHMSHPGMAPVAVEAAERGDGEYEGRLRLTMAGDWLLVVSGRLADGSRITESQPLAGVRPAE